MGEPEVPIHYDLTTHGRTFRCWRGVSGIWYARQTVPKRSPAKVIRADAEIDLHIAVEDWSKEQQKFLVNG